jgi:uncharacterized protein (DUF302 family)
MSYTIDRTFEGEAFSRVVDKTVTALSAKGFGVLTEIDVKATLKKKIDADVGDYLILGACNPEMAYEAMKIEPLVGAMLPCNVIVRSTGANSIMVSAIDPVASMQAISNDKLKALAERVREMLTSVIAAI